MKNNYQKPSTSRIELKLEGGMLAASTRMTGDVKVQDYKDEVGSFDSAYDPFKDATIDTKF